ncbi:MAG: ThiF family adenylyltransferase [Candidatus Peribacteraceae bacterium]|nr:ThiF family adenylyltransferase [Candidatus Peribacteraceae bacterium]
MSLPSNIAIIGCGTLGSSLAYQLTLLSREQDIERLFLIDRDCLEPKNLPYLCAASDTVRYRGRPKAFVLGDMLARLNTNLEVFDFYEFYPECKSFNRLQYSDIFMIDCRDTADQSKDFNVKLNLDGNYGIINFGLVEKRTKKESRYTLGESKYNALLFSTVCIRMINQYEEHKGKKYGIDLNKSCFGACGGIYDISSG